MSEGISASERFISDHQLDAQEKIVDLELLRLEIEMGPDSSEKVWQFRDQLKHIKRGIKVTRQDLHQVPVRRKWLWQRLRIWVYEWSVRGRFE